MIWAVLSTPGPGGLGGVVEGRVGQLLPSSEPCKGVDASVCACRGLAQTVQELGDASGLCLICGLG